MELLRLRNAIPWVLITTATATLCGGEAKAQSKEEGTSSHSFEPSKGVPVRSLATRGMAAGSRTGTPVSPFPSAPQGPDDDDDDEWELSMEYFSFGDASFKRGNGEVSYDRYGLSFELPWLEVDFERYDFTWKDAPTLAFANGSRDPIGSLNSLEVGTRVPYYLSEDLALQFGLGIAMGWEDEFSDSISYESEFGLMWDASEDWNFLIGFGYEYHPDVEVSDPIMPMIGFSWNEDAEQGWSAALGFPETGLRYSFNSISSLALTAYGGGGLFRLADASPISPGGFAEYDSIGVGLQYSHRFEEGLRLDLGAGFSFEDEWRFYDSQGTRLSTDKTDGALGLSFALSYEF